MAPPDDWFDIREIDRDIFIIEEPGHGQCYLIRGKTRAALIDTGLGFRDIRAAVEPLVETPFVVFNTHWHFDHIGGNRLFRHIGIARAEERLLARHIPNATLMSVYIQPCLEKGIPLPGRFLPGAYEISSPPATFTFDDGDTFDLGGRLLKATATPGHTHGSFSFLDSASRSLFCGDLLYRATLYAHFLDSDIDEYIQSLRKLAACKDGLKCLYPAHGDYPVETSFLVPVLKAFRGIKTGALPGSIVEEWGEPVRRYEFEDFAILTKSEGSRGVDLLPFL